MQPSLGQSPIARPCWPRSSLPLLGAGPGPWRPPGAGLRPGSAGRRLICRWCQRAARTLGRGARRNTAAGASKRSGLEPPATPVRAPLRTSFRQPKFSTPGSPALRAATFSAGPPFRQRAFFVSAANGPAVPPSFFWCRRSRCAHDVRLASEFFFCRRHTALSSLCRSNGERSAMPKHVSESRWTRSNCERPLRTSRLRQRPGRVGHRQRSAALRPGRGSGLRRTKSSPPLTVPETGAKAIAGA